MIGIIIKIIIIFYQNNYYLKIINKFKKNEKEKYPLSTIQNH